MKECYILTGVSGSGKSRWAENLMKTRKGAIVSADSFFMKNGMYNFNPTMLNSAHNTCLLSFIEFCRTRMSINNFDLVVDNTNTTTEEIAPYYSIAQAYGFRLHHRIFAVDLQVAAERNIHKVSLESIEAMWDRIVNMQMPRFWRFDSQFVIDQYELSK